MRFLPILAAFLYLVLTVPAFGACNPNNCGGSCTGIGSNGTYEGTCAMTMIPFGQGTMISSCECIQTTFTVPTATSCVQKITRPIEPNPSINTLDIYVNADSLSPSAAESAINSALQGQPNSYEEFLYYNTNGTYMTRASALSSDIHLCPGDTMLPLCQCASPCFATPTATGTCNLSIEVSGSIVAGTGDNQGKNLYPAKVKGITYYSPATYTCDCK